MKHLQSSSIIAKRLGSPEVETRDILEVMKYSASSLVSSVRLSLMMVMGTNLVVSPGSKVTGTSVSDTKSSPEIARGREGEGR